MRFGVRARYVPTKFTAGMSIVVAVGMAVVAASSGLFRVSGPGLLFAFLWFGILLAIVGANVYFLATGRWLLGPQVETDEEGIPVRVMGAQGTVEKRLEELERLKAKGRITAAEYEAERRRILGSI